MFISVELGTTFKKKKFVCIKRVKLDRQKVQACYPITPWNIFKCFSRIAGCQKKKKTQMELAKKELLLMNQ